jgi:hypothetical protein
MAGRSSSAPGRDPSFLDSLSALFTWRKQLMMQSIMSRGAFFLSTSSSSVMAGLSASEGARTPSSYTGESQEVTSVRHDDTSAQSPPFHSQT